MLPALPWEQEAPLGSGSAVEEGLGASWQPKRGKNTLPKKKKKQQITLSLGALANSKHARAGARAGLTGMAENWKLRARKQLGLSQGDL